MDFKQVIVTALVLSVTVYSGCMVWLHTHYKPGVTSTGEGLRQVGDWAWGSVTNLRPARAREHYCSLSTAIEQAAAIHAQHTHIQTHTPPSGTRTVLFQSAGSPLLETGAGLKHALWGAKYFPGGSKGSDLSNYRTALRISEYGQGHSKHSSE